MKRQWSALLVALSLVSVGCLGGGTFNPRPPVIVAPPAVDAPPPLVVITIPDEAAKPLVASRAPAARRALVKANFCNLPDPSGKPQFSPFYIGLDPQTRKAWLDAQRAAGSTHFVLSPSISYPGAPWPGADYYGQADRFADFVAEVLETPAADGYGFTPILILDPGDANPRPRIDDYWPKIAHALQARGLIDDVLVVPGWELVKASDWSSADLSYGLELLHRLAVPHIWLHLSPTRWAGSSNPVEPDDPWQGAESDFWKTHGGQHVEGFLYETENVRQGHDDPRCDPSVESCWRNRLTDGVIRMGNGINGWRVMPFAVFETVAWGQWNGLNSPSYARDIASGADEICRQHGVVCGHGNGLPW